MLRRIIIIGFSILALLFLATSIGLWFFLSSWIPSAGKARLIQELERRAPVTVAIGTMRYEWLRDVVLTDVQVHERRSNETWFAAPSVNIHVGWLSLFLRKTCIFRASSTMAIPCQSIVHLSGRYDLQRQLFTATLKTEPFSLDSMSPFIRKQLPAALAKAQCRITATAQQGPAQALLLQGRITAEEILWDFSPGKLTGQLIIDASALAPQKTGQPWAMKADAHLQNAAVQNIPIVGLIEKLEAQAHFEQSTLTINQLSAKALGADWRAQGTIEPKHYEVALTTARAQLGPLLNSLPNNKQHWSAEGPVDLQAVCRGAAGSEQQPDCTIHLKPQNVKISGDLLSSPLENISGRLQYEWLSRQLALDDLHLTLMDEPLAASGTVGLAKPFNLLLALKGNVPLAAAKDWLKVDSPIKTLDGLAQTDVHISGPAFNPSIEGRIELKNTHVQITGADLTEINGAFLLRKRDAVIQSLHLKMNTHPLAITSTITPSPFMEPRDPDDLLQVVTDIESPEGRCTLRGRLGTKTFFIDNGILTLDKTRLHLAGVIARQAAQESHFTASGSLALDELTELPFDFLHPLAAWQLKGLSDIELELEGRLADFKQSKIEAHLRAEHLTIRDIPLEGVAVALEQDHGAIHLSIPETYIARGKLVADLTVTPRQQQSVYRLQADLAGLELGQLRSLIPAWKERAVTGHASTHAALAGILEQRQSWVGDGWLNVEGQELGDLPLLDKLFRGLFGVLAERLGGLESLRRAQITRASLTWQLINERVRTNDLRLAGTAGTEPVAVYAKGSVGLDQTLDFVIDPEFSEGVLLQAPSSSTLANTILKAAGQLDRFTRLIGQHHLTGTLKKPEYHFKLGPKEVLKEISPAPANLIQQGLQGILDAVHSQDAQ